MERHQCGIATQIDGVHPVELFDEVQDEFGTNSSPRRKLPSMTSPSFCELGGEGQPTKNPSIMLASIWPDSVT